MIQFKFICSTYFFFSLGWCLSSNSLVFSSLSSENNNNNGHVPSSIPSTPTSLDGLVSDTNETNQKDSVPAFDVSRHILNQMGFLTWRHRSNIELVDKSPGLVRELKHLDKLGS